MAHDFWAHHIWCNYAAAGPMEDCKQCKGLFEKYPMTGLTPEELQRKHFPDAIPRTAPKTGDDKC